jgi:uncharacterized protein YecE (DUF72 family)
MSETVSPNPEEYRFRGLHPRVLLGTASDRYAGWIGQIYSEHYRGRITSRQKIVAGKSFREDILPVESVEEYFTHFPLLELDFTFYSLLLDRNLNPTPTHRVLDTYRKHLRPGDRLILKVPQRIFSRKLRQGGIYAANPDYLNADLFIRRFYEPAQALLGDRVTAFVFEQEYLTRKERGSEDDFSARLRSFFQGLPPDHRYHTEVRTEAFLTEPYFKVLEDFGVGQVLSHWTWLPSLWVQFRKGGERFFNRGSRCVIRLMTPRGKRYEEAYAAAYPFDREVEGMMSPGMVEETARILLSAVEQDVEALVTINNRAGGNAPALAQKLSRRFSDLVAEKRPPA